VEREYSPDTYRDLAVDIIGHAPRDVPSFRTVGSNAPHDPWTSAARHQHIAVGPPSAHTAELKRTLLTDYDADVASAYVIDPRWELVCVFTCHIGFLIGEHGAAKANWWAIGLRNSAIDCTSGRVACTSSGHHVRMSNCGGTPRG
jgi:hypothetical protein